MCLAQQTTFKYYAMQVKNCQKTNTANTFVIIVTVFTYPSLNFFIIKEK